jgi:hypothetical protein
MPTLCSTAALYAQATDQAAVHVSNHMYCLMSTRAVQVPEQRVAQTRRQPDHVKR